MRHTNFVRAGAGQRPSARGVMYYMRGGTRAKGGLICQIIR